MESVTTDWRKLNRRRGANADWRQVFYLIYRLNQFKEFELEDVLEAAEKFGIRIEKESLRVKLSNYVRKRLLEKPTRGFYRLTEQGYDYFNIKNSGLAELTKEE